MLKSTAYAAGVAVVYYVVGRLALFLAIPPGYATAVWPAAGVALVAILVFGYRVWPGILAAHLLVNIFTDFDASSTEAMLKSVTLPLAIACGGVLQAVIGATLIRRAIGPSVVLQDQKEIVKFLALGGPISCVVSATIGQICLYGWGRISISDIPFSWFTWWVGDTIGVTATAPLLLAWFAPPERWRARRAALTWPTAVALVLAVVLYVYISEREQQRIHADFERATDTLGRDFTGAVRRHLEAVVTLQDLYASVGTLDRASFASFATPLLGRHPGVQALEWAPVVPAAQRNRLEAAVRREGYPSFAITERDEDGRMVPAAARTLYVPVLFMEPYGGNETALGFDLTSLPSRRQVIDRARDSALPAASGRLVLVQERGQQSGVLVVLPVYERGLPRATVPQRRSALRGYVLGVYRVGDLVRAALLHADSSHIDWTVTDDTAPDGEQVLCERWVGGARLPWSRVATAAVGDHRWSIRFAPATDYAIVHRNWQAWTVLVVGLLFASVLEMMVLLMTERAAAIQRLVEQRTAELTNANAVIRDALKEKETLLQEIHHRVKNNLQVISSLINLQRRKLGPGAQQAALQECQTRVQAIALIHEKLYQARDYSRVPFAQYATGLANDVFHAAGISPGTVNLDVEVAEVALAVDKAIPCGLILNELITNALKHAFPHERRGTVRVELDHTPDGRVRLAVKDDGVGLPGDLDIRHADSLGMQLVTTLAEQLAARLEIKRAGAWTSFEVVFWG
ncbi:MAG TPA: CHASE domain-containing protein [Burkholderiaceae bacterium]|nr:CHASE domain-containing protein [Burkholderiaceae bacterium]